MSKSKLSYNKLIKAVNMRFPDALFSLNHVFKSINEIENKILTSKHDTIIIRDVYDKPQKTDKSKKLILYADTEENKEEEKEKEKETNKELFYKKQNEFYEKKIKNYEDLLFFKNNIIEQKDYFIVKRKENAEAIYYKDVIDALIENGFCRDDCNYRYLHCITKVYINQRYKNSIPLYGLVWDSLN